MLCIKEDLFTEQNTFGGQKTYKGVFRYFDDGKKQMLIIYREEAIDKLVDIIYDLVPELKTCQRGKLTSEKFPCLKHVIHVGQA